ncbi:hypothetical protein NA56DRAFT_696690 [Hyaloscypha hepaticicola]|uniref:SAM domain-containing protein n=1 Tax=Hyaloscypha hepaticicola TaxID=2082293 RepID=A0A2J6QN40_9HELO|nr:hypothetical protein NA56DRAFT_696690 [Hyaloscypha hepaticicola]
MAAEDLQRTLTDLGLEQYLPNCLHAGFHNFQSLSSITEAELTALGVRLGHRRKLLRRIAREHQWPDNRPLPTSYSELQEHRNSVRRRARANINPESIEENYYALTSPAQSQPQSPSPWSREPSCSSDSSVSNQERSDSTRLQLEDVLRTNSRLFPIAIDEKDSSAKEREKVFRALRGLDNLGIQIPAANNLADQTLESEQLLYDVTPRVPIGGLSRVGSSSEAGAAGGAQQLHTAFEAFLQSFNHFLFFFSECELRQSFNPHEWTSDAGLPIDIYLVLALGAKASGSQVVDLQNEWYRRARLRLLSEDCEENLWLMRVLLLICIFEIDDDIDISCRFLSAATNIGLEHGLDAPELTMNEIEEPARSQWFLLQPQPMGIRDLSDNSRFMNIEQPPLLSVHCRNGRLVQMSIAALSNRLREILNDRGDFANHPSPLLYKAHLQALDSWRTELPVYTCLRTPNVEDSRMISPNASYGQKTAILNVQSLFLGTVCVLLQPALMAVLQDKSSSDETELIPYARRCVLSATILIRVCDEIVESRYPFSASWIAQHFLFNATLVLVADMNRSNSRLEQFVSINERLECIQIAQNMLDQVSSASPQAAIVRLFCRAAGISDTMKV